jgi:hypothetical protein
MSTASGILPNWNGVSDARLTEVTTVRKGKLIFTLQQSVQWVGSHPSYFILKSEEFLQNALSCT